MSKGFTHESARIESVEWYTPKFVFDALGIEFDLDPCSPGAGKSFVPTAKHYTIEDDGLASEWAGTVWVNPPHGQQTPKWMRKFREHGDGLALVAARTDVKWFHDYGADADAICFVNGRIKFYQGNLITRPGSPGTGSMILAYGPKATAALAQSGLGAVMAKTDRQAA